MSSLAKKFLYVLLGICLVVVLVYESAVLSFDYYPNKLSHADAIIVLGSGYADSAKGRAIAGLKLYKEGLAPLIILSGGKTNFPTSEAEFMANYISFQSSTTPEILLEDKSTNTIENFQFSLAKSAGKVKSIIIVSDGFHLLRSYLLAKMIGFKNVEWYSAERSGAVRDSSPLHDNYNEFIKIFFEIPLLFLSRIGKMFYR